MKNWFTEKIIDCFMTKTIPIYKGCPNIGDFYEEKGIIKFETIEELEQILNSLDGEIYQNMIEHIEKNYEKALSDIPFEKRVENTIKKYAIK
jgi:AAA15 family ATPase/GTPase